MGAQGARASLRQNYWPTAAGMPAVYPSLKTDIKTDVVVIGAGIMGLNAALELAERGVDVTLVEAEHPATAASGRNGGLVVPSLPRVGPVEVIRALGETQGKDLVQLVANGAQTVFDLIERYGLQCDAVQSGWINPAHAGERVPGLKGRVAAWQKAGSRAQWLDASTTRARIGSATFHGALFDPSGGHLNPFSYTQELARVAVAAGVKLFCNTPVRSIVSAGEGYVVHTDSGTVIARTVLQCTNAMQYDARPLAPLVSRSFVPLNVFQLATEVLPEAVRRSILPGNEALSDSRNNLFAIRYTADGRIVTGGMAPLTQWLAVPRLLRALARRMEMIFPQMGTVRFDYIWRGGAALTPDFLPRLFEVNTNWFAPLGCNGRGIAMTTSLGRRVARYVVDRNPAGLPLPISAAAPIKAHTFARYAPQLLLPVGMLQDAMRR